MKEFTMHDLDNVAKSDLDRWKGWQTTLNGYIKSMILLMKNMIINRLLSRTKG